MKKQSQIWSLGLLILSMTVLILDTQTSLQGAKDGINICLAVVIPSLYPFLFLSAMLPSRLVGTRLPGLRTLGRLCHIPEGAESLLILGLLAGYPVGAGMITDIYRKGRITKSAACRMLGFCSNAGPAFIFGMVSGLFPSIKPVWALWFIHILSSLFVGMVLPSGTEEQCVLCSEQPVNATQALEKSIRSMARICGWIVIFRVILSFLENWFLWLLPNELQSGICGILELSIGILRLNNIANAGARFILCAVLISFGGLCVAMQTVSVTSGLGTGQYFPGKVLQSLFSLILASLFQPLLFPQGDSLIFKPWQYHFMLCGIAILVFLIRKKKSSSIIAADIV